MELHTFPHVSQLCTLIPFFALLMRPVLVSLTLSLEGSDDPAARCILEVSPWGPSAWGLICLDLEAEAGTEVG